MSWLSSPGFSTRPACTPPLAREASTPIRREAMTSGRERERPSGQPKLTGSGKRVHLSWTGLGCGRWRHGCGRHLLGSGDGGRGPCVGRAHCPARDLRLLPARPACQRHLRFALGARQHVRLAPRGRGCCNASRRRRRATCPHGMGSPRSPRSPWTGVHGSGWRTSLGGIAWWRWKSRGKDRSGGPGVAERRGSS